MTHGYDSMDRGVSVLSERDLVGYAERAAIAVLCEMVPEKSRAVEDFLDKVPAGGRAVDGRRQDECGGRVVDAAAAAENEAEKALQLVFASSAPEEAQNERRIKAGWQAPAAARLDRRSDDSAVKESINEVLCG